MSVEYERLVRPEWVGVLCAASAVLASCRAEGAPVPAASAGSTGRVTVIAASRRCAVTSSGVSSSPAATFCIV